jgi:hypothetical protein
MPVSVQSIGSENGGNASRIFSLLTECAEWFSGQLREYPEILTWLVENYGFSPEFIFQKKLGFAPVLGEGQPDPLVAHLQSLGYSLSEMKAASIVNRGGFCRYQGRVMFPFWKNRQVVYFAARATSLTPHNPYETTPSGEFKKYRKLKTRDAANPQIAECIGNDVPFGIDSLRLARQKGYVLVTEGIPDQLAAEQAGEPAISPATTRFNYAQVEQLAGLLHNLDLYLCFDNEENGAGENGAIETARLLEQQGNRVYLIRLPRPDDTEKIDLCEFVRDNGPEVFSELYKSARRLPDYLLEYRPLPRRNEDKALFLTELAALAKLCRYDPISLEDLQNRARHRFEVSLRAVKATFKEPEQDANGYGSSISGSGKAGMEGENPDKRSQADLVMELLATAELFHTAEGKAYCSFEVSGHTETWPVRSRSFKLAVRKKFFQEYRTPLKTQPLEDAVATLEALATDDKPVPVYGRLAFHEGCIYYDLTNSNWEVVRISAEGWEVLPHSPVKFRRTPGITSQVTPQKGGKLSDLLRFVNVNPQEWKLLAAWLVTALNPDCQYPVLCLNGEQGSAKSTASRFIRRLLDPSVSPLRTSPKDERDLWISTNNNWVLAYDNLSGIPSWLSDAWCRIATGGGNATRLLYSDDEEVYFDARRPILTNGIEAIATRSDLLDRSLILTLPALEEAKRKGEKELVAEFEEQLPYLLGGLFDAISTALSRQDQIKLDRLPRMADFTLWSVAAEPAFGGPGELGFLESYRKQREEIHTIALEASSFGQVFMGWFEKASYRLGGHWLGTASDLLKELEASLPEGEKFYFTRQSGWPKNARSLSVLLHRLAPNLRAMGFRIEFDIFSGELKRGISISFGRLSRNEKRHSSTTNMQKSLEEVSMSDAGTQVFSEPVTVTHNSAGQSPVTQNNGGQNPVTQKLAGQNPGTQNVENTTSVVTQNYQGIEDRAESGTQNGAEAIKQPDSGTQNETEKTSQDICVTEKTGDFEPEIAVYGSAVTQNTQNFQILQGSDSSKISPENTPENRADAEKNISQEKSEIGEISVFCVIDHQGVSPEFSGNGHHENSLQDTPPHPAEPARHHAEPATHLTAHGMSHTIPATCMEQEYLGFKEQLEQNRQDYQALQNLKYRIEQSRLPGSQKHSLVSSLISIRDALVNWDNHSYKKNGKEKGEKR